MLILNAFSANMLPPAINARVDFITISPDLARECFEKVESAVDHTDTARIFSQILGMEIPVNRANVVLNSGTT